MKVVKSVSFYYAASKELSSLFETFRLMCNDAIKIAIEGKPSSRFNLEELAYKRLKEYGLHTHYILSACEVAFSVWMNKKRRATPYVKKAYLKIDSQTYVLNHLLLRIPSTPRHFIFLTLRGSDYHLSFVDDPKLKKGSIVITDRMINISFSKQVIEFKPIGYLGVDINERNVTISVTTGLSQRFNDLGTVVEIKERYKEIRAKIGRVARHDNRVRKQLLAKYGERERNRTVQRIHKITKTIVDCAVQNNLGIVLEKLKGIRRLYAKGNGQGASYRGRMNTWVFGEIQRQTNYKAAWLGVPVRYVNPRGTSSNCPDCGSRVALLQDRQLYCQRCDNVWDRDVLASRNLMVCVVPQARPPKGSCEGERGDVGSNPPSRWDGSGTSRFRRVEKVTEPT